MTRWKPRDYIHIKRLTQQNGAIDHGELTLLLNGTKTREKQEGVSDIKFSPDQLDLFIQCKQWCVFVATNLFFFSGAGTPLWLAKIRSSNIFKIHIISLGIKVKSFRLQSCQKLNASLYIKATYVMLKKFKKEHFRISTMKHAPVHYTHKATHLLFFTPVIFSKYTWPRNNHSNTSQNVLQKFHTNKIIDASNCMYSTIIND